MFINQIKGLVRLAFVQLHCTYLGFYKLECSLRITGPAGQIPPRPCPPGVRSLPEARPPGARIPGSAATTVTSSGWWRFLQEAGILSQLWRPQDSRDNSVSGRLSPGHGQGAGYRLSGYFDPPDPRSPGTS